MPDVTDVVYSKIVCDADGKTGSVSGNTDYSPSYGKPVTTGNNYQFYVQMPSGASPKTVVNMVVFMGGPQSGLFRFPQVGEKVLVCRAQNNEYYLIGFVPSSAVPFYPQDAEQNKTLKDAALDLEAATENGKAALEQYIREGYNPSQRNPGDMDDFVKDKGMALRYKRDTNGTGCDKTTGKGAFSEIGFYNKKSKWPDATKDYGEIEDEKKAELEGKDEKEKEAIMKLSEDEFSRIDVLNIQSAGDIESRTENYHLLKAKRIEFLADTDEISPEARADNCGDNYANWDRAKAPLGDNPLDDPAVHGGDAHFRGGGTLIFKAQGEIRVQVGRTTMVIDDKGFSVLTRKVNSNVPLPNDTSFSMNSRDGINMFGESVNIASARKFSVSDAWGAGVESITGRLNISGWQINQKTYDKLQQQWALAFNSIVFARNLILGGMATNPKISYAATIVNLSVDIAKWLLEQWKNRQAILNPLKKYEENVAALQERRNAILDEYREYINQRRVEKINQGIPPRTVYEEYNHASATIEWNRNEPLEATENVLDTASMLVGAEPIEMLMATLNLLLDITAEVYSIIEQSAAIVWRKDLSGSVFNGENKDYGPQEKSDFRDALNLAAMSIDNGLIGVAMTGIALGFKGASAGGPASIRLRQTGDILIKAGEQKNLYAELGQKTAIPASIFTEKSMRWIKGGLVTGKVLSLAENFSNLVLRLEAMHNKIPVYVEKL